MQAHDLSCNPSLAFHASDLPVMSDNSSPICSPNHHSSKNLENVNTHVKNNTDNENNEENRVKNSSFSNNNGTSSEFVRRQRPSRACTQRAAARMQAAAEAESAMTEAERKKKVKRRERLTARLLKEESGEEEEFGKEEGVNEENGEVDGSISSSLVQCSKIVTKLAGDPEPSQFPRWSVRSMWQLASILNFLNVFRPLLNIKVEFSVDEFETAVIAPNNTLCDIHMPLLKAIPPVTRMALGYGTWITVLCRKLRDWWHWVAEGDVPIVASHGTEVEIYNSLDPGVRVLILKALCDIRVEQEDIRNYIDDSIKHGVQLSTFRKERIGGDSHGISYWYENDPIIGHRLYREIRKVDVKKGKGKNVPPIPHSSYQWETVATNLDEFVAVSEHYVLFLDKDIRFWNQRTTAGKQTFIARLLQFLDIVPKLSPEKLFSSKNRTEVSVGKKLKNDMLPEIERVHKKKEKLLKKRHRQALMLDSMMNLDDLVAGRSLRDRKHVTYTFDDYDRSINEAIKITKTKPPSPEPFDRRDPVTKREFSTNGRWAGPSQYSQDVTFSALSPLSPETDEFYEDRNTEGLDRSNRRQQRPQRYSVKDFVEAVSDNEADFDSDDDIVGEVIYNEEYLKKRKQRRNMSSSSEGDEEYNWDEENHKEQEEEEDEEEEDDSLSTSEESDEPRRFRALPSRTRRETKLRSVDELQSGLRRSTRATRNPINYRQYELSESETESKKPPKKSNALVERSNSSDNAEFSIGSQESEDNIDRQEMDANQPFEAHPEIGDADQTDQLGEQSNGRDQEEIGGVRKRRFLDLNELAPGSGFDDCPSSMNNEDNDDF